MRGSGNCPHLELRRVWGQLRGRAEVSALHVGRRGQEGSEGLVWRGYPCWCGELLWFCVAMVSCRGEVSRAALSPQTGWLSPLSALTWGHLRWVISPPVPAWHLEARRTARPTQGASFCMDSPQNARDFLPQSINLQKWALLCGRLPLHPLWLQSDLMNTAWRPKG